MTDQSGAGEVVSKVIQGRWPRKLARAADVLAGIDTEIASWNLEHAVLAPARVSRSRPSDIEIFRPRVVDSIPLADWEGRFHDGVHNLRAALDGLAWELAHIEGLQPTNPNKIAFPVTQNANAWEGATRHLATVPGSLLDRLKGCQPWGRPDPQDPDPLSLLSLIDNHDKHRSEGVTFDIIPELDQARASQPLQSTDSSDDPWNEAALWLRFTIAPPPAPCTPEMLPVFVIPLVVFHGLIRTVPSAGRWLSGETHRMIQFVLNGVWPEPDTPDELGGDWWRP